MRTVAVFCVSADENRILEVHDMVHAIRHVNASGTRTRLIVVGRRSDEVRGEIGEALAASGIEWAILGNLPAEEISEVLSKADVLLFLRGAVSPTRGSAMAGIACALPIVGYSGGVRGTPLEKAGLFLAPYRDREVLAGALARVLADTELWETLCDKSRDAQEKYFSWNTIADRYVVAMNSAASERSSTCP